MCGSISIIGLGPGILDWCAPGSIKAIQQADVILGYHKYLQQIEAICPDIPRQGSGMRHEIERACHAIELAFQGKRVAVVSGGDAGIYGMAGLIMELIETQSGPSIAVEVLPGISALNAAAALLGAPLMTDFVAISLSDYLTPLVTILTRLQAAIQGDFVICLYNPKSHQRTEPFDQCLQLMKTNLGADRPVGIVRAAFREEQQVTVTKLKCLAELEIGMDCLIVIGNRATRIINGKLVTPRGYPIEAQRGENL
jgi:precorrin-3B C17-methyltransferase